MLRPTRLVAPLAAGALVLAACGNVHGGSTAAPAVAGKPNIVYILVDDMSMNLLSHMTNTKADLQPSGITFTNFFTSNSLCCPSRGTILTGKYPHNSKIRTNDWPLGGFGRYCDHDRNSSLGVYLQAASYTTAFVGKFLNGYDPAGSGEHPTAPPCVPPDPQDENPPDPNYPPNFVPPGWDTWYVPGKAYGEFSWDAVHREDGGSASTETITGDDEDNYFTDVANTKATSFIATHASDDKAFFLEVSTFAVHSGNPGGDKGGELFPGAPRDRSSETTWQGWDAPTYPTGGNCGVPGDGGCAAVPFPDGAEGQASYGKRPTGWPDWENAEHMAGDEAEKTMLKKLYLERVQMIQAVDKLVGDVYDALDAAQILDNTYIVFSTDNGLHLGEHGLLYGKSTAYDHDSRLPLIIRPPTGTTIVRHQEDSIVQTTDLMPTFIDLAGGTVPSDVDGVSLKQTLTGSVPADWRNGALIEYRKPTKGGDDERAFDPDREHITVDDVEVPATRPPTYHAIRTAQYLYVDYGPLDQAGLPASGEAEIYNLRADKDPYETKNLYRSYDRSIPVQKAFLDALDTAVRSYAACSAASCRHFVAPAFVPPTAGRTSR